MDCAGRRNFGAKKGWLRSLHETHAVLRFYSRTLSCHACAARRAWHDSAKRCGIGGLLRGRLHLFEASHSPGAALSIKNQPIIRSIPAGLGRREFFCKGPPRCVWSSLDMHTKCLENGETLAWRPRFPYSVSGANLSL